MSKLPDPPAYDVWVTRSGRTMHGRRCQRTKRSGEQCECRAAAGYNVCNKHGAPNMARVARGERKDPSKASLRTGMYATKLKNTLKDKINEAEKTFNAQQAAKKSGATTQTLLEEYLERFTPANPGDAMQITQDDVDNLMALAGQLSRTAKHLADIEAKEQLTFEDLVYIANQLTRLFVSLSLGHIHEPNARSRFLEDAEAGLIRIFNRAGERGVVEADYPPECSVPATVRRDSGSN